MNKDLINIYYFHEQFLLSPGQLASFVNKFILLEVIEMNELLIGLTLKGRKWVFENRVGIFMSSVQMYWKKNKEMDSTSVSISNLPYIPFNKKVDSRLVDEYLNKNQFL